MEGVRFKKIFAFFIFMILIMLLVPFVLFLVPSWFLNDPVLLRLCITFGIILAIIKLATYRSKRRLKAMGEEMRQRAYKSWNLKNMEIRYRNDSNNDI